MPFRLKKLTKFDVEMVELVMGSPLGKMPVTPTYKDYFRLGEKRGVLHIRHEKGVSAYCAWAIPTYSATRLLREMRERKQQAAEKRRVKAAAARELDKLKKASL